MIFSWHTNRRPMVARPQALQCAKHLTRTCGTCTHWDGPLRGRGECRIYAGPTEGATRAWTCDDWTRRSAAPEVRE